MKERTMCFPEITTSDIGKALYFMDNRCELVGVKYTEDKYCNQPRFTMAFTGMNIIIHNQTYFAGDGRPDFSLLPDLLIKISDFIVLQPEVSGGIL